eukprot:Filipodium_phascolosomae@DN2563_c0_g1_i1.p1
MKTYDDGVPAVMVDYATSTIIPTDKDRKSCLAFQSRVGVIDLTPPEHLQIAMVEHARKHVSEHRTLIDPTSYTFFEPQKIDDESTDPSSDTMPKPAPEAPLIDDEASIKPDLLSDPPAGAFTFTDEVISHYEDKVLLSVLDTRDIYAWSVNTMTRFVPNTNKIKLLADCVSAINAGEAITTYEIYKAANEAYYEDSTALIPKPNMFAPCSTVSENRIRGYLRDVDADDRSEGVRRWIRESILPMPPLYLYNLLFELLEADPSKRPGLFGSLLLMYETFAKEWKLRIDPYAWIVAVLTEVVMRGSLPILNLANIISHKHMWLRNGMENWPTVENAMKALQSQVDNFKDWNNEDTSMTLKKMVSVIPKEEAKSERITRLIDREKHSIDELRRLSSRPTITPEMMGKFAIEAEQCIAKVDRLMYLVLEAAFSLEQRATKSYKGAQVLTCFQLCDYLCKKLSPNPERVEGVDELVQHIKDKKNDICGKEQ